MLPSCFACCLHLAQRLTWFPCPATLRWYQVLRLLPALLAPLNLNAALQRQLPRQRQGRSASMAKQRRFFSVVAWSDYPWKQSQNVRDRGIIGTLLETAGNRHGKSGPGITGQPGSPFLIYVLNFQVHKKKEKQLQQQNSITEAISVQPSLAQARLPREAKRQF